MLNNNRMTRNRAIFCLLICLMLNFLCVIIKLIVYGGILYGDYKRNKREEESIG